MARILLQIIKSQILQFSLIAGCLLLLTLQPTMAQSPNPPDRGQASFSLQMEDLTIPYNVFGLYIMPGETVTIHIKSPADETRKTRYWLKSPNDSIQINNRSFTFTAPQQSGLVSYTIHQEQPTDKIQLNVFVKVPASKINRKNYTLNGFRIGPYPTPRSTNSYLYRAPDGYIEVTPENQHTRIAPHFTLREFLTKQKSGFPKYVVLRERLLRKLEVILEEVNKQGINTSSLTIMSGYRTPYYNKAIGNVPYSRHIYGGAADIYIDERPRDDYMDDLNNDNAFNYKDAEILRDIINQTFRKPAYEHLKGGLSLYRENNRLGPFVHTDVRGTRARW